MRRKEQRVCAQCGKVEPKRLWLHPTKMFKIWAGSSHLVNLCTWECSRLWYAREREERNGSMGQ